MLSVPSEGANVDLWTHDDGSGRQQWYIPDMSNDVEKEPMGCCSISSTNMNCASWDYLNGKCIKLTKRNIGCNRGFWHSDK